MERSPGKGLFIAYVVVAILIAGGLGLLAGIFRPRLGVAGGAGLVLYFVGALLAHVIVGDFAGLTAPIVPFLMAVASLTLGVKNMRRRTSAS